MKQIVFLVLIIGLGARYRCSGQTFTSSNLPIVVISTNNVPIPNEPKIPGTMKIIDHGTGIRNFVSDSGNIYTGDIGIEIRGSYSASLPQKPYGVETRDATGANLNVPLWGWPAENDWILLATYNDKVFMRNVLAFKLFSEFGNYASRWKFVELQLNGSYKGIYVFCEKIKRDDGRVDIAKLDPDENSGEPLTGGYIFKIDYWDYSNSWLSPFHPIGHSGFDVHFVYEYPDPEVLSEQQAAYIKSYVSEYEGRLYNPFIHDSTAGYYQMMDLNSYLDYFIVNEVSRNNDGFKKSFYFFKDRDGKDKRIHCGPVWDFDWAWKNIDECSIFRNTDGSGWAYMVNDCYPDVNSPGWHIRLLQDTNFANALQCRWQLFRNSFLQTDSLMHWVDSNENYLWEAQQRHYTKWPILGLNVGTPVVGPIPTTFQGEIDDFKNWIRLRLNWLDANMPGHCYGFTGLQGQAAPNAPVVFPNPAQDVVYVELPAASPGAWLQLFDNRSRLLDVPCTFDDNHFSLDLQNISPGIYFARINYPNHTNKVVRIVHIR